MPGCQPLSQALPGTKAPLPGSLNISKEDTSPLAKDPIKATPPDDLFKGHLLPQADGARRRGQGVGLGQQGWAGPGGPWPAQQGGAQG